MRYIISADDYGVTRGVTDNILGAFDHGLLTNVSLIANGRAVEYAVEQSLERPQLTLSVHLNFVEGEPLSPPESVPALVGADGQFDQSFPSLWRRSLSARDRERESLRAQLAHEIRAQLDRAIALRGPAWEPRVDSHLHVHAIPLVFEALLDVHRERPLRYVRTLAEPLFRSPASPNAVRSYAGPNLAKNALLRHLSRRLVRELDREGIPHCDHFVGVLFTGTMSVGVVRGALAHLTKRAARDDVVEILFHPGGAAPGEEDSWPDRLSAFREQYFSPWRARERATLEDPAFREVLAGHLPYDPRGADARPHG